MHTRTLLAPCLARNIMLLGDRTTITKRHIILARARDCLDPDSFIMFKFLKG